MLDTMINSFSVAEYNAAYAALLTLTEDVPSEQKYAQENVYEKRKHFARHITVTYEGSMAKRGLSHLEQNHSSIVSQVGKVL